MPVQRGEEKMCSGMSPKMINQGNNEGKIRVFILEPHPDDALGSASGLIYSRISNSKEHCQLDKKILHKILRSDCEKKSVQKEAEVTVFTMSKPNENDPLCRNYDLTAYNTQNGTDKHEWSVNVCQHIHCDLADYPYNMRNQDPKIPYEDKVLEYLAQYPEYRRLEKIVKEIFTRAVEENAYVAIPAGFEHPLHILVTYASCEVLNRTNFDRDRLILYVDHPYDFQLMGTGRTEEVKTFLQRRISRSLIRCNDVDAQQHTIGEAVREIYGKTHFGEFDGSLERTGCSYFLTEHAYDALRWDLKLWRIRVLYATSQALPYYKRGGLADVARTYCESMLDCIDDVRILMPRYLGEDEAIHFGEKEGKNVSFQQKIGGEEYTFEISPQVWPPLTYYLVSIWDAKGNALSFSEEKEAGRSFAVLSDGLLAKGLNVLDFTMDVLHCNDWQMGLLPFLMKTKYRAQYSMVKSIFTIHFAGYRGVFPKTEILHLLEDKPNWKCTPGMIRKIESLKQKDFRKLVDGKQYFMSFFRAGCEYADKVTTVSKGYAEELEHYTEFSRIPVTGIRNGIEVPSDPYLENIRTKKEFHSYKKEAKRRLQHELGLVEDPSVPLISVVSRLSIEKGLDMLRNIVPLLLEERMPNESNIGRIPQIVVVGDDADPLLRPYSSFFAMFETKYPGQFAYRPFSRDLEFSVYRASDILLMPSLSEACGTTQMRAMAYGVVPVVSSVSGFRDTVLSYLRLDEREKQHWEKGVGFISYPDCWTFLEVIKEAISIYCENPDVWEKITEYNRKTDFRWKNTSLAKYLDVYYSLLSTGGE